jgi:hypothetical protein
MGPAEYNYRMIANEVISSAPLDYREWLTFIEVAILSLSLLIVVFFTARELRMQRRHNRLSVLPDLGFEIVTQTDKPISIGLSNSGLGPAKITSITFYRDGKEFDGSSFDGIQELIEGELGSMYSANLLVYATISANETRQLIQLESPINSEGEASPSLQFLNRLSIKVGYESFYGEKFEVARKIIPDSPPVGD